MDSGLPPGQRAYHGLVFAYIKAGDAKGAWSASRRAHASGALLLAESYILLIHGYMQVRIHACLCLIGSYTRSAFSLSLPAEGHKLLRVGRRSDSVG